MCPFGRCNPISGECQCAAGKQGSNCSEDCRPGSYGIDCEGTRDCQNGENCYPVNGTCYCLPGFQGDNCEQMQDTFNVLVTAIDDFNDTLSCNS